MTIHWKSGLGSLSPLEGGECPKGQRHFEKVLPFSLRLQTDVVANFGDHLNPLTHSDNLLRTRPRLWRTPTPLRRSHHGRIIAWAVRIMGFGTDDLSISRAKCWPDIRGRLLKKVPNVC